jgi:hypothetical protein
MEATADSRSVWKGRRTALVVAHPGHELLVHGWLEQARPLVFVLSAGVGDNSGPAIAITSRIVKRAGARASCFFGRYTDRGLHNSLFLREADRFNAVVQELADAFVNESIDFVAGDAAEGLDPIHDLCRVLIDAAVGIASSVRPGLKNYEFPLLGNRGACSSTLHQTVAGEAWIRKFASCQAYAAPIDEVRRQIVNDGIDSLRQESLRPAMPWAIQNRRNVLYTRAENGRIPAIHFREHFLPLAGSIHEFAAGGYADAA